MTQEDCNEENHLTGQALSDVAAPRAKEHGVPEVRSLTGLRGIAAVDVVINHVAQGHIWLVNALAFHNPAVDVFFCLSGYTLSMVYRLGAGEHIDWYRFAVARFARVYPLYALILVIATGYSAAWGINAFQAYSPGELSTEALRQALMVNAWPIIGTGVHWADPLWSLSIEALCYVAVFPTCFVLSPRVRRLPANMLLLGIIAGSFVTFITYVLLYNPAVNSHRVPAATGFLVHWVASIRGVSMFGAGWLGYLVVQQFPELKRAFGYSADVFAAGMILIVVGQALGALNTELLVVLAPFLVIGLASKASWIDRFLSSSVPHALGLISYSLYLWHWPIMMFVWRWLPSISANDSWRMAVTVTLSLISATASYLLIENPARASLRRILAPS